MSEGWIKVYRKFQDHWLNEPSRPRTKREAWEDMLMSVNYKSSDVMIRGTIYRCERGQSMLSIDSWAAKFGWSRMQVRTFFQMLKNDGMITIRNTHRTTLLTICNYESYQGENPEEEPTEQPENNHVTAHQTVHQITTNKEIKKERIINNTNHACAREENSLQKEDFGGGVTFDQFSDDFLNNFSMKEDLIRKHGMNEATYDKILDNWLIDRKVAEDWNFKQGLNGNLLKRTQSDLRAYFTNYLKIEYEKLKAKKDGKPKRITTLDEAVARMLGE